MKTRIRLCTYLLFIVLSFSMSSYAQEEEPSRLVSLAIAQLGIAYTDCDPEFIVEKKHPVDEKYTILIIPTINTIDEEYLVLDSHILIVDSTTGVIKNKFFEAKRWYSDAIFITQIAIDDQVYKVSENNSAFGIRVFSRSGSQPNPYASESLSLFLPVADSLKIIVDYLETKEFQGEWDLNCAGSSTETERDISITNTKTNGFYDIEVLQTIAVTKSFEVGEDCEKKTTQTWAIKMLKYMDGNYPVKNE